MRLIFLDTETTGLNPAQGDRIIEVGCVEMIDRVITGNHLHVYVNPQRPSHPDALRVHGLTEEFLSGKPLFSAVADELLAFVAGAEVVIHNASFDIGFLDEELRRLSRPRFAAGLSRITDSLFMAREAYPGKSNSLDALCKRLEVDNRHRTTHGALLDAGLLAEVYLRMTRGQKAFAVEAEQAPKHDEPVETLDLRALISHLLPATEAELSEHTLMIEELNSACKQGAIWGRSVAN
jgi:DNA polymerase-3 subunit epsilon